MLKLIIDADAHYFSDADHLHLLIHSMDWSVLHRVDRWQRLAADFSYSMTWRCIHDDTIIDGHSLTRAIVLSRPYHSHFVIEAGRTTRLCCSSKDSPPLTNDSPSPHQFIRSLFTLTFSYTCSSSSSIIRKGMAIPSSIISPRPNHFLHSLSPLTLVVMVVVVVVVV